jgi:hypothetical protein
VISRLDRFLLGHSRQRERALVDAALGREEAASRALAEADATRFAADMQALERVPHVVLGTTEAGARYRVPLADLDGAHGHATGATGSGKSFAIAGLLDQLIAHQLRGEPIALVVLALQGFLVDFVLGALGTRLLGVSESQREAVLGRLTVLRFHRGDFLTPWQLLVPDPAVPVLAQAAAYAEVIEQILGGRLGARQEASLTNLLALAMAGSPPWTLPELRAYLHAPELLQKRAASLPLPEVRLFFRERFARESAASVDGLKSRLETLLRDESLRAVLTGPSRLDLRGCFSPGSVTLLDFGGAPLTFEGSRALAGLVLQALAFEVFNPRRPRDAMVMLVGDELQQALSGAGVRVMDALLTTARAQRVGTITIHQALSQLPRELHDLYATNVRMRWLFRPSRDELRAQTDLLPTDPADPGARVTEERLARFSNLPRQHLIFAERGGAFGPRVLQSPRFAPVALDRLPRDLRTALERGRAGVSRAELLTRARDHEAEAFARLEGARVPHTPDVSGRAGRSR